jgi:formate dehydrogenase major subunit
MNAITKVETVNLAATEVSFSINGKEVKGFAHETILDVAKRNGVAIPHLCYKDGLEPAGNCRACVVEIDGERVLAPSCCRHPSNNMKVTTNSDRAEKSQKMVLELLLSDMPEADYTRHNEVDFWAEKLGLGKPRFAPRTQVVADHSHPAIAMPVYSALAVFGHVAMSKSTM